MAFTARFSGYCDKCGNRFDRGDTITAIGRGRPGVRAGSRNYLCEKCAPVSVVRVASPKVESNGHSGSREQAIAEVTSRVLSQIDPKFDAIRAEMVKVVRLDISVDGKIRNQIKVGIQHEKFEKLVKLVLSLAPEERNIWVAGPAGSGKTTAARKLSEVLGKVWEKEIPFDFNGAIDTEYKLSGFVDANGRVISTAFRRIWENGGVYLFDECDASMNGALMAFNAALANGHAAFPDGTIKRHADTVILAAANTWGFGGDGNYVGRAKLDAAFLDRFVTLTWNYDESLEKLLAGNDSWVAIVQQVRAAAIRSGAQIVVSPRASIKGAQLIASGMPNADVVEAIFGRYRSHSAWPTVGMAAENFSRQAA